MAGFRKHRQVRAGITVIAGRCAKEINLAARRLQLVAQQIREQPAQPWPASKHIFRAAHRLAALQRQIGHGATTGLPRLSAAGHQLHTLASGGFGHGQAGPVCAHDKGAGFIQTHIVLARLHLRPPPAHVGRRHQFMINLQFREHIPRAAQAGIEIGRQLQPSRQREQRQPELAFPLPPQLHPAQHPARIDFSIAIAHPDLPSFPARRCPRIARPISINQRDTMAHLAQSQRRPPTERAGADHHHIRRLRRALPLQRGLRRGGRSCHAAGCCQACRLQKCATLHVSPRFWRVRS